MADQSSVSNASSYQGIGPFWDEHDSTGVGEDEPAELVLRPGMERHDVALERAPHARLRALADVRGVSEETLANLVLKERVGQLEQEQPGG
ncbi:MAG: hypothetical protein GVY09_08585 [Gammaproteobacteria bacterium]|jgi:hypothetical protein|nr:hypothetical protein [Gammaproteobacteria bacterium]